MDLNSFNCTCSVISDTELKYIGADNTPLVNFSIVIDGYKSAVFLDVEIWGHNAERAVKHFKKGSRLNLVGRLKQDVWEDSEGNPKRKFVFVAENYSFVGKNKKDD